MAVGGAAVALPWPLDVRGVLSVTHPDRPPPARPAVHEWGAAVKPKYRQALLSSGRRSAGPGLIPELSIMTLELPSTITLRASTCPFTAMQCVLFQI